MKQTFLIALLLISNNAVAQSCRSLVQEPSLHLQDCSGVHVLRVKGPPVERARALGALLAKEALSSEVIRYFTQKVSDLAHEKAGWLGFPLTLAYHQVVRLLHRNTPVDLAREVDAMAEAMNVDPIVLRRGLSLPDTATIIQGLGSHPWLPFIPTAGCTSVAARLTPAGFAYGRNLDFAGVNRWDKHPMILVSDPAEGSRELKHLAIGADGLPFGGITGVNEAGITFAVHQNFTRDISLSGLPMIFVGELVLREARSLDEAVAILRRHRPANQWTFVLTNLRTGEARAVESSTRVFLERKAEGRFFVQTNHSMHPATQERENSSFGTLFNSRLRMKMAYSMLEREAMSSASIAKILAYQSDPEGRLSSYSDILKAETIQTVIFESIPGKPLQLLVSLDPAPSSSGRYASFPLESFWSDQLTDSFVEAPFQTAQPIQRQKQTAFAEAYRLYFDEHKPLAAIDALGDQRSLGALLFRAAALLQAERPGESLQETELALRDPRFLNEPEHIRLSLERVRLVSLLRLGKTSEARNLAARLVGELATAGEAAKPLLDLAQRVLERRWIPGWLLELRFDFFSGDLSGRKS